MTNGLLLEDNQPSRDALNYLNTEEAGSEGKRIAIAPQTHNHSVNSFSGMDVQSKQTNILADDSGNRMDVHAFSYEKIQKAEQPAQIEEINYAGMEELEFQSKNARRNSQLTVNTALMHNKNHTQSLEAISAMEQSIKDTEVAPNDREAVLPIEDNAAKIFVLLSDNDEDVASNDEEVKEDSILGHGQKQLSSVSVQKPDNSLIARSQEGVLKRDHQDTLLDNTAAHDYNQTQKDSVVNCTGTDSNIKQLSVAGVSEDHTTNKIINNHGSNHDYGNTHPEQHSRLTSGCDVFKANGGLSSENSHQKTRSAVEKGNLEQRCTDQSEGRPNADSQRSSAVSQYFH